MYIWTYETIDRLTDSDAGESITRAIGRGGPWKSGLFWAQMALSSLIAIFRAEKVSIFRAHPFQWPLKKMLAASKSLHSAPYKQQLH